MGATKLCQASLWTQESLAKQGGGNNIPTTALYQIVSQPQHSCSKHETLQKLYQLRKFWSLLVPEINPAIEGMENISRPKIFSSLMVPKPRES